MGTDGGLIDGGREWRVSCLECEMTWVGTVDEMRVLAAKMAVEECENCGRRCGIVIGEGEESQKAPPLRRPRREGYKPKPGWIF